jgi:hypothetical protein
MNGGGDIVRAVPGQKDIIAPSQPAPNQTTDPLCCQVVAHDARRAVAATWRAMFAQVAFETAAGQAAYSPSRDQHQRTAFGIR